jgi:hypothetical protein
MGVQQTASLVEKAKDAANGTAKSQRDDGHPKMRVEKRTGRHGSTENGLPRSTTGEGIRSQGLDRINK